MRKLLNLDIFNIALIFLTWRIFLILALVFALSFLPLGYTDRFLGGGSVNYHLVPEVFSWANFDGEHYLSIAIFGYKGLEQVFFPIFPILISILSKPFTSDFFSALLSGTLTGLFISNVSFFLSLIIFRKLIEIDFSKKISLLSILILAAFPTSFFFGAVYNESLFLLISLSAFYFARKGNWFWAAVLGGFSSATRIFGILLFPAFFIEAYQQKAKFHKFFWIFLIPLGLGIYMFYQYLTVGDPLAFYNLQKFVGEQRQSGFTLLPQVYFRYIKMLITVDFYNPIYQTILLEFAMGILFFILPIYGVFKKIRLSYIMYVLLGLLLSTIQGSFSSVPRYMLVFFPSFIAAALWLSNKSLVFKLTIITLSALLLFFETVLFLRGYWIA